MRNTRYTSKCAFSKTQAKKTNARSQNHSYTNGDKLLE